MENEYSFQYMVSTNSASISSGTLHVKMGLRKKEIPVRSLRHLYVKRNQAGGFMEMALAYAEAEKKRVYRIYSNMEEAGFNALVEDLVKLRPDIDIRNMDEKEAFKLLGAADTERIALFAAPAIILGVLAVAMAPFLIHGLDGGHERVTAAKLASGYKPDTRNITVSGRALFSSSVRKTTKRKGVATKRLFVPIVPFDFKRGDEIHLVMKTPDMLGFRIRSLQKQSSFKGMLRNVWWEGLDGDVEDHFKEKMKLPLAKNVQLLEYDADNGMDLMIALLVLGVSSVLLGGIIAFLYIKRYK